MALGVVEQLEMVQVQKHQGAMLAGARRCRHALLEAIHQQAPIGQTCERVEKGQAPNLFFIMALLRDIAHDGDQVGLSIAVNLGDGQVNGEQTAIAAAATRLLGQAGNAKAVRTEAVAQVVFLEMGVGVVNQQGGTLADDL